MAKTEPTETTGAEETPEDPLAAFRDANGAVPAYAERAHALYEAATFYMSRLAETRNAGSAAAETCERYGHDAPRGLCLRCGLGTDVTNAQAREREDAHQRLADRQAWLRSRGG